MLLFGYMVAMNHPNPSTGAMRATRAIGAIRAIKATRVVGLSVDSRCHMLSENLWFVLCKCHIMTHKVEKSPGWMGFMGLVGQGG